MPADGGTETVLLVEDDAAVRTVTRRVLEGKGYRVIAVGDGMEALSLAQQHAGPIHLLITDVVLPNLSGPETVARLARIRPELRVLYVSGYADAALDRLPPMDDCSGFLEKPYTPATLARRVRELLDWAPAA